MCLAVFNTEQLILYTDSKPMLIVNLARRKLICTRVFQHYNFYLDLIIITPIIYPIPSGV